MKSALKYFIIFIGGILLFPVAVVGFWIYSTYKISSYLLSEKDKYFDMKGFFSNTKNIIASILLLICVTIIPINFVNYTKDLYKYQEEMAQQEKIEEEKEAKRIYEIKKEQVLDPERRIKKEIDLIDSVHDVSTLSNEEIKEYNLSKEEIKKFEEDRKIAINNYLDKKIIEEFESLAKEYVVENAESSVYKVYRHEKMDYYGFNDDKSSVTISGYYKGRNYNLVYVRGDYDITFDTKTKEIIKVDLPKERIDSTKHPRNSKTR